MSVYLLAFLLAGWLAARLGLLAGGKNLKLEKFEVEVEEEEKKKRRQFLTGHVEARGKDDEVNRIYICRERETVYFASTAMIITLNDYFYYIYALSLCLRLNIFLSLIIAYSYLVPGGLLSLISPLVDISHA
ncbi:uncharacterized protein ARB_07293 [Trichophyton benhamiae CBS 112371]|uniref:Uncharacterized protein n=1 Tax=Arthroderma benhamiae (strain ATCC MYA-4681 / CBS 112371) TaxID=663331 RepID=D4ASS8_ARTBC|nr:uncharacterized protein ARB_07293 [Trichophyton benhamiae CBS 112371]EFE33828.1 hypothetical protein ARB_07293 [Trichophyton benhamiae CBS 112371]